MRTTLSRLAAAVLAAASFFAAGDGSAPVTAGDPMAEPVSPSDRPVIRLHGAFGAVVGGLPEAPATAHPGIGLDPFLRGAPLRLLTDEDRGEVLVSSVVAHQPGGGAVVRLSDGAVEFEGPDTVGATVVVATVEFAGGSTQHAWLLQVPDRIGDVDALLEIVPPPILLVSGQGRMTGTPGNGCYVYLCSDIGGLGPVRRLEALPVSVGETLAAETGDGTGLVGWVGRLRAVGALSDVIAERRGTARSGIDDVVLLEGLEAPWAGEWLLELRVDFDRERGWLWHAYRLMAE